jgi:hypothetical protein
VRKGRGGRRNGREEEGGRRREEGGRRKEGGISEASRIPNPVLSDLRILMPRKCREGRGGDGVRSREEREGEGGR